MVVNRKRNKTRLSKFVAAALTGFMTVAAGASIAWASTTVQVRHRNGTVSSLTPYVGSARVAAIRGRLPAEHHNFGLFRESGRNELYLRSRSHGRHQPGLDPCDGHRRVRLVSAMRANRAQTGLRGRGVVA